MDYSENVKASLESDLAYAKWYAQQPDNKKAEMIKSGYLFATNHIVQQATSRNPFSTSADIIFEFIRHTQKEEYPPETFAFIQQKMQERSEKEWKERFKAMKKNLGWSYDQMATYIGASNGASVKASINRKLPAFAKLAVCVFEQMQKNQADTISKNDSAENQ